MFLMFFLNNTRLGWELVILTGDPGYRNNARFRNLPPLTDLLSNVL